MNGRESNQQGLFAALVGDGRPLITFTGLALGLSGMFALFLSATRHFLPHDVAFLGMTPDSLCSISECRVVHFMFHDRVSFGGSLVAIATLYLWLAAFPLRETSLGVVVAAGEQFDWIWQLLVLFGIWLSGHVAWRGNVSTAANFYLGDGECVLELGQSTSFFALLKPSGWPSWRSTYGLGRYLMLGTAIGLVAGGFTIMTIGATTVFVPQDLAYMGLDVEQLRDINPHLVPLIAHDRAGFGGGVCCCGTTLLFCIWCGRPSRSLWQALFIAWAAGAGTAILIHPIIGYTDFTHLAPAYLGTGVFGVCFALTHCTMYRNTMNEIES